MHAADDDGAEPQSAPAPALAPAQRAAASSAAAAGSASGWEGADVSKEATGLQLRLADGSRMVGPHLLLPETWAFARATGYILEHACLQSQLAWLFPADCVHLGMPRRVGTIFAGLPRSRLMPQDRMRQLLPERGFKASGTTSLGVRHCMHACMRRSRASTRHTRWATSAASSAPRAPTRPPRSP